MNAIERVCAALTRRRIVHRLDGDAAIYLHMSGRSRGCLSIKRRAMILVDEDSLPEATIAAKQGGFEIAGHQIRINSGSPFGGGVVEIAPCSVSGIEDGAVVVNGITAAPVSQLVYQKLERFRLEDKLHVQQMDHARLITPEIEAGLSEILRARLGEIRATE